MNLKFSSPPLLVTLHSETLRTDGAKSDAEELLSALEEETRPIIFTAPNIDPGGEAIRTEIEKFISNHPKSVLVENLGSLAYYSLMELAICM